MKAWKKGAIVGGSVPFVLIFSFIISVRSGIVKVGTLHGGFGVVLIYAIIIAIILASIGAVIGYLIDKYKK